MLLQQLKAIKTIKEIRHRHCQYRHGVYQTSLRQIETELLVNEEKKLAEAQRRKEYEGQAYAELANTGATVGRLGQIRNEVKAMLTNEQAIDQYLQSVTEIYALNKQELHNIKQELLVMEQKLEGVNDVMTIALEQAEKAFDGKSQDRNDDLAIAKYVKPL